MEIETIVMPNTRLQGKEIEQILPLSSEDLGFSTLILDF
jgi:hypothetical protein